MASNKDTEHISWVNTPFKKETYKALSVFAADRGQHIHKTIEEAVEKLIVSEGKDSKNDRLRLRASDLEREDREIDKHQIKRLIAENEAHPDECKLEQIETFCENLGIHMADLVDEMKRHPHVMEIMKTSKVTKAQAWLLENLTPDEDITVKTLMLLAERAKYKWRTVQYARDNINANTKYYIKAHKPNVSWAWCLIEPKTEEA